MQSGARCAFPFGAGRHRLPDMESALDYHTARALLEWQVEFGATEAICDTPVNRFEIKPEPRKAAVAASAKPEQSAPAILPIQAQQVDGVGEAKRAAELAPDLDSLRTAMAAFEHCELKRGARNLVFGEGALPADVMVIGEAPGRDEDREGKPFIGQAGTLLDKMLAAIDLDRAQNVYVTNVLPWRPPQNRDPKPEEIAMLLPFLEKHVALVQPKALVVMGNIACQAVLHKRGITRLRGDWAEAFGLPVLPMFHPAYLLRQTDRKREAWADLLALKAKLREMT